MTKTAVSSFLAVLALVGCSKKPTAADVCQKLTGQGLAANCHEAKPGGLGAAAVERFDFDLPSVPGKSAGVMRFDKEETFDSTVRAFEGAAVLAGPHRYGNKKALIFVQANEGLSLEEGKKLKAAVDGL